MKQRLLTYGVILAIVLLALPWLPSSFATPFTTCACVNESIAILNPFRDRAPEKAALAYAAALDTGSCKTAVRFHSQQMADLVCKHVQYELTQSGSVSAWSVVNRSVDGR